MTHDEDDILICFKSETLQSQLALDIMILINKIQVLFRHHLHDIHNWRHDRTALPRGIHQRVDDNHCRLEDRQHGPSARQIKGRNTRE